MGGAKIVQIADWSSPFVEKSKWYRRTCGWFLGFAETENCEAKELQKKKGSVEAEEQETGDNWGKQAMNENEKACS